MTNLEHLIELSIAALQADDEDAVQRISAQLDRIADGIDPIRELPMQ